MSDTFHDYTIRINQIIVIMYNLSYIILLRKTSWLDAQTHCKADSMTLLQYDSGITDTEIKDMHYIMASTFGEVMFLGLKRNNQVN